MYIHVYRCSRVSCVDLVLDCLECESAMERESCPAGDFTSTVTMVTHYVVYILTLNRLYILITII